MKTNLPNQMNVECLQPEEAVINLRIMESLMSSLLIMTMVTAQILTNPNHRFHLPFPIRTIALENLLQIQLCIMETKDTAQLLNLIQTTIPFADLNQWIA